MSMASEVAIATPIASPIWSLKYGKCHLSGDSTTPSSDTNSDATTFLIRTSSDSMFQPNIRQAKYPLVELLRIGELLRTPLPRTPVNRGPELTRGAPTDQQAPPSLRGGGGDFFSTDAFYGAGS